MPKPMSWKWKLLIAGIIGFMVMLVFVVTPWGHEFMYNRIKSTFDETPEADRRSLPQADSFLSLAGWRGAVCQDDKAAMGMYREFCGLPKDTKDNGGVFETGKLKSPFVSPDGSIGWGPAHPRAPEAFFHYIEYFQVDHSGYMTNGECFNYYRLFYTWMSKYGPDKKPHPLFNKYWPKIKDIVAQKPMDWPQDINPQAPKAAPYTPPPGEEVKDDKKPAAK